MLTQERSPKLTLGTLENVLLNSELGNNQAPGTVAGLRTSADRVVWEKDPHSPDFMRSLFWTTSLCLRLRLLLVVLKDDVEGPRPGPGPARIS